MFHVEQVHFKAQPFNLGFNLDATYIKITLTSDHTSDDCRKFDH